METRRLEYFVILAREGSFRRAAEELHMSQPALSQQIQRLEAEIGAILVDRSVQPFELTPAGRTLLHRTHRILGELSEMDAVAESSRRGHVGKLRVGIVPSLLSSSVPAVLRRFRSVYPQVEVSLRRESTWAIIEQLEDQRLDAGFTFSGRGGHGLEFATLYDDAFVAVMPRGHPLAELPVVRMGDLRSEALLMLARRGLPDLHDAVISACATAGFLPQIIEVGLHMPGAGYVDQIGLVGAGYGIGLIPGAVATLDVEGVAYRPVMKPSIVLPTSIGWHRGSRNASTALFRRFVLEDYRARAHAGRTTVPDLVSRMPG